MNAGRVEVPDVEDERGAEPGKLLRDVVFRRDGVEAPRRVDRDGILSTDPLELRDHAGGFAP